MKAMEKLQETYSEHFSEVFKTITTDNGSEFADLADLRRCLIRLSTMLIPTHPVIRLQ
jgi:IS30 family transposase